MTHKQPIKESEQKGRLVTISGHASVIPPDVIHLWDNCQNPFDFLNSMRDATPEEQETLQKNIEARAIPTGINFWDYLNKGENNMKEIKIKYHNKDIEKLTYIDGKSDWIDLRAAEDVTLKAGEFKLINLGVSMKLPEGYEAHIVPRSSTFKNFGIIQTNHQAVIDNSYCGDNDIWRYPAYALKDTEIHVNDRICQFRIVENQPKINFVEVDFLDGQDRGGIGSTGKQ